MLMAVAMLVAALSIYAGAAEGCYNCMAANGTFNGRIVLKSTVKEYVGGTIVECPTNRLLADRIDEYKVTKTYACNNCGAWGYDDISYTTSRVHLH